VNSYTYPPSQSQPHVLFDPNAPNREDSVLPDPVFNPLPFNTNFVLDQNSNSSNQPHSDVTNTLSTWWPNSDPITSAEQAPASYIPFDPNIKELDFLQGWDPNSFLPMSMSFQWDLADLWTVKGRSGAAEYGSGSV
jgi:hypothetical protein